MWAWYVMRRWGGGSPSAVGWRFRWVDLGWGPLTWLSAVASQLVMYGVVVLFHIPLTSNVEDVSDPDVTRVYQIVDGAGGGASRHRWSRSSCSAGWSCAGSSPGSGRCRRSRCRGCCSGSPTPTRSRGAGNLGLGAGAVRGRCRARHVGLPRCAASVPTVIAHAIFNGVVLSIILSGLLDDADKELGHGHLAAAARRGALAADGQPSNWLSIRRTSPNQTAVRMTAGRSTVDSGSSVDGVDDCDVLDLRPRLALDVLGDDRPQPMPRLARRRRRRGGRSLQRGRDRRPRPHGRRPRAGRCDSTGRAHRVRATVGTADDLDAEIEVGDHAPHDRQLLVVLLPEDRRRRARSPPAAS